MDSGALSAIVIRLRHILISLLSLAALFLSEGCERNGISCERASKSTHTSQFATTCELYGNVSRFAVRIQYVKICVNSTASMCRGEYGYLAQAVNICLTRNCCRRLISDFLRVVEPEAVKARKGQRFKRKQYWAAGVNDAWPQDQHDKWQRFGLFFHQSCDAYSGSFNWVKVWWTNSNPRLIASYYLEACRRFGGMAQFYPPRALSNFELIRA